VDFLCRHRLRFREAGDFVRAENLQNRCFGIIRAISEVDMGTILFQGGFRFRQILFQMVQRVILDLASEAAQGIRVLVVVKQNFVALFRAGCGAIDDSGLLLIRNGLGVGVDQLVHGLYGLLDT
jgi:hypothetical protein